ncbi:MAG: hypothetical protein LBP92_05915, partial [Deltaproteobacteria bacterium]|nr:hypothetical protein [Deltaproteobacteria bacterium]
MLSLSWPGGGVFPGERQKNWHLAGGCTIIYLVNLVALLFSLKYLITASSTSVFHRPLLAFDTN